MRSTTGTQQRRCWALRSKRLLCPDSEFTDSALIRDEKDAFKAMGDLDLSSGCRVCIGVGEPVIVQHRKPDGLRQPDADGAFPADAVLQD